MTLMVIMIVIRLPISLFFFSRYPGWVMRVYYHNLDDDFEGLRLLCPLFCRHPNVDLCDVDALPEPFGDLRGAQRIGQSHLQKKKINYKKSAKTTTV